MELLDRGGLQPPYLGVDPLAKDRRAALLEHYRRVIPWLLPHAEDTPLIVALYPDGLGQHPTFLASLHADPPDTMRTIPVHSQSGVVRYLAFAENAALWEVHRGAIELHTWTPVKGDPNRAKFARIILAPTTPGDLPLLKTAAVAVRTALREHGLDAVAGIDPGGITLWIPFDDAPEYPALRAWLHGVADAVIAAHPETFTHGREPDRVRIDLGSNAPGRWSALPYSVRGDVGLTMLTPVAWEHLADATPATLGDALSVDVFTSELARIPPQQFAPLAFATLAEEADVTHGHNHVVDALKQLLADGKARAADDLCAAGIAQKLLPPETKPEYIVNAVRGLIGRQQVRGERPDFVELVDGRFRLNIPVEPFPGEHRADIADPQLDALCTRLRDSANRKIAPSDDDKGNFGAPFERAVADAFTWLGMIAQRDGGHGAPDVVVTAPLGATAFTAAVECKSFDGAAPHVQYVAASEASRFRDQIGAQYAMLIGAGFPGDKPLDDELQKHSVALWSVEDLIAILRADAVHPIAWPDLITLFGPGRSADAIAEFTFKHRHGPTERARIVMRIMLEEGLKYQRSLAVPDVQVERTDAHLTVDALALLVNQRLEHDGELARASEEDVRAALAVATSPLFDYARMDGDNVTIVSRMQVAAPDQA